MFEVEGDRMSRLAAARLGRRGFIAHGLAGTAAVLAAPIAARAQGTAPGGNAQSAVIDVNRARTDPIPIAIPDFGGDSPLARDFAQVITSDLGRSGLFRPLDPAAFIQAGPPTGDVPNFQNWRALGTQALVT